MADIINLRTVRKQQARSAALAKGNENATRFGLNKALRDLTKARAEKSARDLEGHKLDSAVPPMPQDAALEAPQSAPPNTVALFRTRPKADQA